MIFRIIFFLALIIVLSLGGTWLFQNDGVISADWLGYRIETSVAFLSIAFSSILFVSLLFVEIILWIKNTPSRIAHNITTQRNIKGLTMLNEGFVSLLDGDIKRAKDLAKVSARLLPKQPYTLLLAAETSKLMGQFDEAERYYNKMLENKSTEIVALKGLVTNAKNEGHLDKAINLARRAKELKPNNNWSDLALLELYKKVGKWDEAKAIIDETKKTSWFINILRKDKDENNIRERAVILLMLAKKLYNEGNVEESYKYTKQAFKILPNFLPVIITHTNNMLALGKKRQAAMIIEDAWSKSHMKNLQKCMLGFTRNLQKRSS